MNYRFDELTKSMAQSVTRRTALKKFGVGLAGLALACFGLANKAGAATSSQCLAGGQACGTPAECVKNCCSHKPVVRLNRNFTLSYVCAK